MLPSRSEVAHNRNVMETPMSFAPLAGRLAAKVAEIRPAAGAEISWANFMALFWCAIFEMLILLCEALDARAVAVPAARDTECRPVLAVHPRHPAMPGAGRVLRLVRADDVPTMPSRRDAAVAGTVEPSPHNARPTWAPPWPGPCWRPPRNVVFLRKRAPAFQVSARLFCYDVATKFFMA